MDVYPTELKLCGNRELLIVWSDGQRRQYSFVALRNQCPCATCREKRRGQQEKPVGLLPVLSMQEAQPLQIQAMRPIGNYAYNIAFSDGHDTGIFTFEHLRALGRIDEEN
jgi:DUF971 family protein